MWTRRSLRTDSLKQQTHYHPYKYNDVLLSHAIIYFAFKSRKLASSINYYQVKNPKFCFFDFKVVILRLNLET